MPEPHWNTSGRLPPSGSMRWIEGREREQQRAMDALGRIFIAARAHRSGRSAARLSLCRDIGGARDSGRVIEMPFGGALFGGFGFARPRRPAQRSAVRNRCDKVSRSSARAGSLASAVPDRSGRRAASATSPSLRSSARCWDTVEFAQIQESRRVRRPNARPRQLAQDHQAMAVRQRLQHLLRRAGGVAHLFGFYFHICVYTNISNISQAAAGAA